MANCRIMAASRNAMLDALRTALGSGCTIKIYTGTQPANGDAALSGNTLLGTLTCSNPVGAASSGGTLTFGTITGDNAADNSGTASWARVRNSGGTDGLDCDVTATGGGGAITLNTVGIVAGGPIDLTSFTVTIPAA